MMKMRDFTRLNRQKLMHSHGTEDAAGRRLPNGIYDLPGMSRPPRPHPSKATLRMEATEAWQTWSLTHASSC